MASYSFWLELERKTIHLSSLWIVFVIWWLPYKLALALLMIVLAGMLAFELLRYHPRTISFVPKVLTRTLRVHETQSGVLRLTGATYTVLAAVLSLLLFTKLVAMTALTIMLVGDAFAALIGKPFGRIRFWGRSLEGCTAFLVSSLLALFILAMLITPPGAYLWAGFIATLAGIGAELLASRIKLDDNLAITLGAGGAMVCCYPF